MKKMYLVSITIVVLTLFSCTNKTNETIPQRKDISELVFASGMLQADNQYNLTAQTDGYLVQVNFDEGTIVNKGKILAVIDNDQNIINAENAGQLRKVANENVNASAPALLEIQAKIDAATAKLEQDTRQLERFQRLHESNSISTTEYEIALLNLTNSRSNLTALKKQYDNQQVNARQQQIIQRNASEIGNLLREQNKLRALNAGKVYIKKKQLGDYVRKGDVVAVIASTMVIYANLNVDETGMAKIKVGQKVAIKLNTNKDAVYEATIRQILPAFDDLSRSFIVKAYFDKIPKFNIIGTQLEANIFIGTKKNALVIPMEYLRYGNKVWIKEKEELVTVKPGIISSEWVEILGGLEVGQTIVKEDP